jgi:hypothetical protein
MVNKENIAQGKYYVYWKLAKIYIFYVVSALTHATEGRSLETFLTLKVEKKKAVFWDVTPCGSCKKRCFGGT